MSAYTKWDGPKPAELLGVGILSTMAIFLDVLQAAVKV